MGELKLFFSMISGDMYYVESDEVKNLGTDQIPLIKKPSSSCKKCYGRFYLGFDPNKKIYIPCPKCMNRCIDWPAMKDKEITVATPKTTNEIADHEFIMAAERANIEGE